MSLNKWLNGKSTQNKENATPFCFHNHGCNNIFLAVIPEDILKNLKNNRQYPSFPQSIPFYTNVLSINYEILEDSVPVKTPSGSYGYSNNSLSGLIHEKSFGHSLGIEFSEESLCPSDHPCKPNTCSSKESKQSKSSTLNLFCLSRD